VKLVGSLPQLGSWNWVNGMTMHTNELDWPIWKVGVVIDVNHLRRLNIRSLEYKYIITEEGSESQWESIMSNRIIFMDAYSMGSNQSLFIDDVFG